MRPPIIDLLDPRNQANECIFINLNSEAQLGLGTIAPSLYFCCLTYYQRHSRPSRNV